MNVRSFILYLCIGLLSIYGSHFIAASIASPLQLLWPSVVALGIILVTRNAFVGLLIGAISGAVILTGGDLLRAAESVFVQQFLPIWMSPWKVSALVFTLLLGGFAGLIEAGGGLRNLVDRLLKTSDAIVEPPSARRMQSTVLGFGLLVFFDGLANTLLVGRVLRSAADTVRVSREKLAYLADTTGAAVACLAFISTWIAFQLSMIEKGFQLAGIEGASPYTYFFQSIPLNFYCWFALALAALSIWKDFNPGAMRDRELAARNRPFNRVHMQKEAAKAINERSRFGWVAAVLPIGVLIFTVPLLAYLLGREAGSDFSLATFGEAYARAEGQVPYILIGASLLASAVAALFLFAKRPPQSIGEVADVYKRGVFDLAKPALILISAWMLAGAVESLGTASWLSEQLAATLSPRWLPAAIFLLSAVIAFSTGTSWGTMALTMPLAIPLVITAGGEGLILGDLGFYISAVIGAVFSGAVFGDHCSPFSDTTIVASVAAGVAPFDHFITQLPYALIAGVVALVAGFVLVGFSTAAWISHLAGALLLLLFVQSKRKLPSN